MENKNKQFYSHTKKKEKRRKHQQQQQQNLREKITSI